MERSKSEGCSAIPLLLGEGRQRSPAGSGDLLDKPSGISYLIQIVNF
jgi:hypothetical protein